ncbi:hypothetical protein CHIBITOTORO_00220 [Serratia phage vB_SmaM-ChibiTotoro]|nr:hypothetical protein CHIBITOTORO_00220 [Serratia phage vB_SmaM-ChibiTotoro]
MTKHSVTKSQLEDVSKLIKCIDQSVAGEWSNIHYGKVSEMCLLRDALSALLNSNAARKLEAVEHKSDAAHIAELEAVNKQVAGERDEAKRELAKTKRSLKESENNVRTLRATNHHHGRGFQCVSDSRARIAKLCDERFKKIEDLRAENSEQKATNDALAKQLDDSKATIASWIKQGERDDRYIGELKAENEKLKAENVDLNDDMADQTLELRQLLNNANQHIASLTQPAASSSMNELREQVRDLTHENIKLRQQREDFGAKYAALDARYDNALQGVEKAERTILALAGVLADKPAAAKEQEKKVIVPYLADYGQKGSDYIVELNQLLKSQGFKIYRGTMDDHSPDAF